MKLGFRVHELAEGPGTSHKSAQAPPEPKPHAPPTKASSAMEMETGDYEQTEWKYQPYVKDTTAQVEGPALCLECGDACKQEIQDLTTLVSPAIRAPHRRPKRMRSSCPTQK